MKLLKKGARGIIFPAIVKLGLEKALLWNSKRNLLNLCYHGVVSQEGKKYSYFRHISKEIFDQHLKYFKKNFDIISLQKAFEYNKNGESPKRKSITITFDDGFENNYNTVLPMLEKYNIPATIFISGMCAEGSKDNLMWTDGIELIKLLEKGNFITIDGLDFKKDSSNRVYNADIGQFGVDYIRTLPKNKQNSIVDELFDRYDLRKRKKEFPSECWKLMDKSTIIKLSKSSLISIGSHGHNHYDFRYIEKEEVRTDLSESKKILENLLQKEIDMIAFPYGSYDNETKKIAKEVGYTKLLGLDLRCEDDEQDLNILPRLMVSSTTTFESNIIRICRNFLN